MSDQDKGPDSGSPRARTRRQTYKGGWELTGQFYEMWCTRQRNRRSKAAAGRRTYASALSYDSRQKMQAKAAWERILQKRLPHPWLYVEHMRNDDRDARVVYHHERSLAFATARRQEKAARKAAHRERLSQGFVWRGGTVGGNDRYQRKPFQHSGLVSDLHPILLFFASKLPKGRALVCGDDNAVIGPAPHRSKLLGCDKAYIVGNAKVRGFLRVDIDRPLSVAEIRKACRTAGIPLPNIAVGHADASGTLLNPHLLWLLGESVSFTDRSLPRFRSLFRAVLRGLTAALVPYGADAGGYSNAMRVKNPLSPLWHREVMAEAPYSLEALKGTVDLTVKLPSSSETGPVLPDHPDPAIAAGSNTLFNRLRAWAYDQVLSVRGSDGMDLETFTEMVVAKLRELAPWLTADGGIRPGEGSRRRHSVEAMASKVAEWTWKNYRVKVRQRLSEAEVSARQAEAGRRSSAARANRSRELLVEVVRTIVAEGGAPTPRMVFERARAEGHSLSLRTIQRHWDKVSSLGRGLASNSG